MAGLLANPKFFLIDSNGDPAAGWKINTYEVGTTTPKATYTTAAAGSANTNPVILDSRGEADIWWDGEYKIVVTDADDVTIYTVDNYSHGTLLLGDNDHLYLGDGSDLDLFHDSTDSHIRNNTGDFNISARSTSALLSLKTWNSADSEKDCIVLGGAIPVVKMYYNGVLLASTSSTGFDLAAGNKLSMDRTTEDAAFVDFNATADADATSAISTLTTSGSVTHHIQIEINGVTAWIPCSTTDPT